MNVTMFDPGNFTPHYVENLCNELAKLDLKVNVITSQGLFEQSWRGVPYGVHHYFFKTTEGGAKQFFRRHALLRRAIKVLSYPAGLRRTWKALQDQAPGVFHVQWALLPPLDAVLLRKLRSRSWRVIYTAHDVDFELGGLLRRWWYRHIYRDAHAVIVHTETLQRKLSQTAGDILREVRTVPEGISMLPLSPDANPSSARRFLGLDPTAPLFLFFGFIKPYKGLEYLIRAWPRVVAQYPDARLLIAGEALSSIDPFERLVRSLGVAGSVELRPGYVPRSEVQHYFCAADAVVLPYTHTSTSGVIPVAYRYGRPVIATSVGALSEFVKEGETGYLVPPRSEAALADAMCRAIRERERLAEMGDRAREWFETERSWERAARSTAELYRALAADTAAIPQRITA
ncbi:MAG TPA: glycosyltransferase family 4 protein [Bryobacteraceae bacterium]|nr:glycosyltransferase family 4 protein [Bryobacteraceae bacterium]